MPRRPLNGVTRSLLASYASAEELLDEARNLLQRASNRICTFEMSWSGGVLNNAAQHPTADALVKILNTIEMHQDRFRSYGEVLFDEEIEVVPYRYQG